MEDTALDYLQHTFGYSEFRLQQGEIIQTLIDGDDAVVLMPTGGGKSLCYQIPSLVRSGTGIIISPLIALMHDQVTALRELGINAAYLNSALDADTARQTEADLINKPVPEPTTILLSGFGLLGIGVYLRRRFKKA